MRYSVQPRDLKLEKAMGFYGLLKIGELPDFRRKMPFIVRNIGKNISKNLSSKYNLKLLDHAKQSATDAFKIAPKKKQKRQKQLVI